MNELINSLYIIYLIIIFQTLIFKLTNDEINYLCVSNFKIKNYLKLSYSKSLIENSLKVVYILSYYLFLKFDNLLVFLLTMFSLIPLLYFNFIKLKKVEIDECLVNKKSFFTINIIFTIILYFSLFFIRKEIFLLVILFKILLIPLFTILEYFVYSLINKNNKKNKGTEKEIL